MSLLCEPVGLAIYDSKLCARMPPSRTMTLPNDASTSLLDYLLMMKGCYVRVSMKSQNRTLEGTVSVSQRHSRSLRLPIRKIDCEGFYLPEISGLCDAIRRHIVGLRQSYR